MKASFSKYINVNGRLLDLSVPQVMGILNVTPDSFYADSRKQTELEIAERAKQILDEGASIIDIGAYSSRPNAEHISAEEEMKRLRTGLEILNRNHPDAIISVDTFRANVAEICVKDYGVAMINDIAAGEMDASMFDTVARLNVPYIMMHMKGTPQNMQQNSCYDNLIKEVFIYFAQKVDLLRDMGVKDLILDPGFGFGKTLEQNYQLMNYLDDFREFKLPLLVGISRKSMITKLLDIASQDALNGTTVLNTISLMKGADILRVHDVKHAVEAVKLVRTVESFEK
ncbi:dihydropteroate synthase [uncultured Bacteroides sp.]|uniref:dihydropteroate synthase n=1 Tax=uncultured Bacteroides sp. TaxID=162156 RepID=UPI002AAA652B|nr:dihydropteroate synthase [uncultured Bacteroides sp.]